VLRTVHRRASPRAGRRSRGDTDFSGHDHPQVLLLDLRHDLPTLSVDIEVVLLAVEATVRASEDEALVDERIQPGDIGLELGYLEPLLRSTELALVVVVKHGAPPSVELAATPAVVPAPSDDRQVRRDYVVPVTSKTDGRNHVHAYTVGDGDLG
jgi:hypothetical protein